MYELVQIAEHSYYINCPAKIGLYLAGGSEVYLIDSGSDKEAGRKVRQILEKNNWKLKAIFNTHSNADHIGGNQYLQRQTGCKIYAPAIECSFTQHPILEPSFLYGGFPPQDLTHKFLLAQESAAEPLTKEALPDGMETIPLPGHFFNMAGFRTPDRVIYLADCLSSRETLEKYQIGFLYDAAAYLDTLEMVKSLQADMFVPAHAEAAPSVAALAQYNIDKVHEIAAHILSLCGEPQTFEEILKKLFDAYGLTLNFEQYVLVGSTVRSYLAWLKNTGRLNSIFQDNWLRWQRQD